MVKENYAIWLKHFVYLGESSLGVIKNSSMQLRPSPENKIGARFFNKRKARDGQKKDNVTGIQSVERSIVRFINCLVDLNIFTGIPVI